MHRNSLSLHWTPSQITSHRKNLFPFLSLALSNTRASFMFLRLSFSFDYTRIYTYTCTRTSSRWWRRWDERISLKLCRYILYVYNIHVNVCMCVCVWAYTYSVGDAAEWKPLLGINCFQMHTEPLGNSIVWACVFYTSLSICVFFFSMNFYTTDKHFKSYSAAAVAAGVSESRIYDAFVYIVCIYLHRMYNETLFNIPLVITVDRPNHSTELSYGDSIDR